ncbi:MAG: hypothetical protein BGO01_10460 [Armatimonadetes bacterium 55-13]|nr:hypothetical protein [Armatimonadota bacterium]OJU62820.1 MAG: hypothetical protein BGO01_10460 [Armatimonadetes bacterium 55-13]
MKYFVVLPDGQRFGPADLPLLNQWASEGRILPDTLLEEEGTLRRLSASALPGLNLAGTMAQPTSPMTNSNPFPPTGQAPLYPGQPDAQGYQGYYRGPGPGVGFGESDLNLAWIFGALSLLVCFGGGCFPGCGLIGLVFPILGLVFANKAQQKGHPNTQGARILCIVGLVLQILSLIGAVGLMTLGNRF